MLQPDVRAPIGHKGVCLALISRDPDDEGTAKDATQMYIVIGTRPTRTLRVLWALEEMGLPYENRSDPPRSAAVRQQNPSGKVPVLICPTDTGPVALTDSTAILTFLSDRHGQLTNPAGSIARAQQDSLTQVILDECDALLWTAARHSFILPAEHRLPAIKDSLRWEFGQNLARLADRLQGPFLMGAQMTIADIIFAHCLSWAVAAKFPVDPPAMRHYHDRMRARPAYLRASA